MAAMLDKVKDFFGFEDEIEEEFEIEEEEVEPVLTNSKKNNANSKVVSIHTAVSAKVSIVKPNSYEDAADICDDLKNRKIVVVNTGSLEAKVAQRLLDFMGGASYVLGGELSEIEKGIYILSPSNVEVSNELKNELSSRGVFNWGK